MSGGGFTFNGLVAAAGTDLVGNYSGPGGSAGGFAMLNTVTGAVTTFCGTFTGAGGGRLVIVDFHGGHGLWWLGQYGERRKWFHPRTAIGKQPKPIE